MKVSKKSFTLLKREEISEIYTMEHPPDEKKESQDPIQEGKMDKSDEDLIQSDEIKNLDESLIQTGALASENINKHMGVQSDNVETLKNQDIDIQSNNKEKNDSTDTIGSQVCSTDGKTEKNQDTEMGNIENEKIQETKITEDMEVQHNPNQMTESMCTADSTTDTNPIIIDLCDDDTIEMYDLTDSKINLNNSSECDSSNKATSEVEEVCNERRGTNVASTDSYAETLETIIIDLCDDDDDDVSVTPELKDGPILNNEPIICDDSDCDEEVATSSTREETTFENNDEDVPKELCQICGYVGISENSNQLTRYLYFNLPKVILKYDPEVNPDHFSLQINYDKYDTGCLEKVSVHVDGKCEESKIKSDATESEANNEEYKVENFQFTDNIITLQEDYGMDTKQNIYESSYDIDKSVIAPKDAQFTFLDAEDKQCDTNKVKLECGEGSSNITNATNNSSIKSEKICAKDDIQVLSPSASFNFPTTLMEDIVSENIKQITAIAKMKNKPKKEEKSVGINNGREGSCTENVQQQTASFEDANTNLASSYFYDTPPSHSNSNEEFFDAVEYISESIAQEISLTRKPCTGLHSTPSVNIMNEPIPGPSGITIERNRDETADVRSEENTANDFQEIFEFSSDEDTELLEEEKNTHSEKSSPRDDTPKTKESRKHEDMEDNEEKKNPKKMKLN